MLLVREAQVVKAVTDSDVGNPEEVLMDVFTLEVTSFHLINTVRLLCVELRQPEVALGRLQAIVTFD